jgi:hypothetical protein
MTAMASGVTVRTIVLSRFALDGGAMHGIIPRVLWQRAHKPDDKHRIPLVARGVVVDHAPSGSRTLIEVGMGQRWSERERGFYDLAPGPDAPEVLREAGVDPDTITHVVLTHLHWDHAGGLRTSDGALAFPKAEHVVGERCLAHAEHPAEKDAGSFHPDDIAFLLREGRVRRWREGEPLAPGMSGRISNGHTEGLIIPDRGARRWPAARGADRSRPHAHPREAELGDGLRQPAGGERRGEAGAVRGSGAGGGRRGAVPRPRAGDGVDGEG